VESDYRFSYFCLVAGECKIDQRSRKKCQYCRYQACLAAGMKPGWVLKRENNEVLVENKRKTKKTESVFKKPRPPPLLKSKNFINAEEKMEVNYLVKTSGHFDSSKIGGLGVELVREFVRLIAFQHPISKYGQTRLKRVFARRSRRFARKLGDFQRLKKADQEIVMELNDFFLHITQCNSAATKQYPNDDRDEYLHLFQPVPDLETAADASDGWR